jgi:hypothetical protein
VDATASTLVASFHVDATPHMQITFSGFPVQRIETQPLLVRLSTEKVNTTNA